MPAIKKWKHRLKVFGAVIGALSGVIIVPPACHAVFSDRSIRLGVNEEADVALPKDSVTLMTYNIAHGRGSIKDTEYPGTRDFFDKIGIERAAGFIHEYGLNCAVSEEQMLKNLDGIASAISDNAVDIVLLNEVDSKSSCSHNTNQVKYLAEKTGMRHYAFGPSWDFWYPGLYHEEGGNAMLSRYPLEGYNITYGGSGISGWLAGEHTYLDMKINLGNGNKIAFIGAHLSSYSRAKRNSQAQTLANRAEQLVSDGYPTIIAGDLNSEPRVILEEEKDVKERVLEILLGSGHFQQYWKLNQHSDSQALQSMVTWPASDRIIDHLLASLPIRYKNCHVPKIGFSDHEPLICELRFRD